MEAVKKNLTEFMNEHEDTITQVKNKMVETKTKVEEIVLNKKENVNNTNESPVINKESNVEESKTSSLTMEGGRDGTESDLVEKNQKKISPFYGSSTAYGNKDLENDTKANTESEKSKDNIENLKKFTENIILKAEKLFNDISDKAEVKKIADPLEAKLLVVRTKFTELKDRSFTKRDKEKNETKSKQSSDHLVANLVATTENTTKKVLVNAKDALKKAASKVGIFDEDGNKTGIKNSAKEGKRELSMTNTVCRSRRFSINNEEDTYPEIDCE